MNVAILGNSYLGEIPLAREITPEQLAQEAAKSGSSTFVQDLIKQLVNVTGDTAKAYLQAKLAQANTQQDKNDIQALMSKLDAGELQVRRGLPGGTTVWIVGGSLAILALVILANRKRPRRRRR